LGSPGAGKRTSESFRKQHEIAREGIRGHYGPGERRRIRRRERYRAGELRGKALRQVFLVARARDRIGFGSHRLDQRLRVAARTLAPRIARYRVGGAQQVMQPRLVTRRGHRAKLHISGGVGRRRARDAVPGGVRGGLDRMLAIEREVIHARRGQAHFMRAACGGVDVPARAGHAMPVELADIGELARDHVGARDGLPVFVPYAHLQRRGQTRYGGARGDRGDRGGKSEKGGDVPQGTIRAATTLRPSPSRML
jgi:hypothetical protein